MTEPARPRTVIDAIGPALDAALRDRPGGDPDPFSLSFSDSALIVRREAGGCTLDLLIPRDLGPSVDEALSAWAARQGLTDAVDQETTAVIARERHAPRSGRLSWNMEIGRKPSDVTQVRVEWIRGR